MDIAHAAGEYGAAGLVLVPLSPREKAPRTKGWNLRERCRVPPAHAGNIGIAHAYSGTCALDVDDLDATRDRLAQDGVDVDALLADPAAVRIDSGRPGRAKLLYRLDEPLHSKVFRTRAADGRRLTAFELRCAAADGLTVQDVLPPSIHPDTGQPYQWVGDWRAIPPIPPALLAFWRASLQGRPDAPAPSAAPGVDRLRQLLAHHSPDAGYDAWLKVGMALHAATAGSGDGLALWDEWSAKGATYKGVDDLAGRWAGFREGSISPDWLTFGVPAVAGDFDDVSAQAAASVQRSDAPPVRVKAMRLRPGTLAQVEGALRAQVGGLQLRFDEFFGAILVGPSDAVAVPGEFCGHGLRPFKDSDYARIRIELEKQLRIRATQYDVREAVRLVAEENPIDSLRDWVDSLKWDGRKRCAEFFTKHFRAENSPYAHAVGQYFWSALAGRALEPGVKADMVPVLVGEQGLRKSSGLKALLPHGELFCEIDLAARDADLSRLLRGKSIAELAEMRGYSAKDKAAIKQFFSTQADAHIPKYQEFEERRGRRYVFVGTTNESEFLDDFTGERRYLPLEVGRVDLDAIVRDRLQLWAEAARIFKGFGIRYERAEVLARKVVDDFKIEHPFEEPIQQWLIRPSDDLAAVDSPTRNSQTVFTITDVMRHALQLETGRQTAAQQKAVAAILRALGFKRRKFKRDGKSLQGWATPATWAARLGL